MAKTDQQLVADYLNGEEGVLPELINRYLKPAYNFAYRLTGNAQDAQDISQETFLKMWKNLKKYRPEESFKTWLFTIARNTAFDLMRKKRNLVFSDISGNSTEDSFEEKLADEFSLPADEIISQMENKKMLDDLLAQLPYNYREVILLHYLDELTFDEIGKILGKPLNTVKSWHRRALLELRKLSSAPK